MSFEVDADGQVLSVWDHLDYLCEGADGPGPERIRVNPYDPERKLWVVNQTHHEIHVLSNDGSKLIATYGEEECLAMTRITMEVLRTWRFSQTDVFWSLMGC